MTNLFPPVLESKAMAIPFSDNDKNYVIEFYVPEINDPIVFTKEAVGIKHIQVVLKYKSTGESAVNPANSPDNMTLFFPTIYDDGDNPYIVYDQDTRMCKLSIPYGLFKNGYPERGMTYTAQVRFGASELWQTTDPNKNPNFSNFRNWRAQQTSTVPSRFGEWSNVQTVYCYGAAKTSLTYNLEDFVPELFYTYAPEDNDPLEQCKIVYSYNTINGNLMKSLVFNGVAQSDGSYTLRVKLPVAPVQVIHVSLEAVTINGTLRGRTLNIPPIGSISGVIPELTSPMRFQDIALKGEELEDGVIAKKIENNIPLGIFYFVSIYRTNVFTFDTIKIKENIEMGANTEVSFKDFSVEMGEDYQYIAIAKDNNGKLKQLVPVYPWGFENSGYGRLMSLDSVFLADKKHQLRIQGNVNVSTFKRNTADQFQTTIGSKYPFYSRSAETSYRSFQLTGAITINMDPTASFLKNDQTDGLRWEDDNGSQLLILNRDLYGDLEYSRSRIRVGNDSLTKHEIIEYGLVDDGIRGPATIYDEYYARGHQSKIEPVRSDEMVFMERKFRECVMNWLADGKPKLFRSETEGNMIVMASSVSFSPLDKSGRIVYTVSMTLTEIAELNLDNLIDYDLMPIEITTHTIRNFLTELHKGDIISERDYLALIEIDSRLIDYFKRDGHGDYEVRNEANEEILQEILDNITDYTFLRGGPQQPIYNNFVFINSEDFNIGNLSTKELKEKGFVGENLLNGVHFVNGLPEGHTLEFSLVTPMELPTGFKLVSESDSVRIKFTPGILTESQLPTRWTFKIDEKSGPEAIDTKYFTISVGSIYDPLTVGDSTIAAKTTEDEIAIVINVSGGVKFKDLSGNPNDIDYVFTTENLPFGLTLNPNGTITGKIVEATDMNENDIVVTVTDAIGNSGEANIEYGKIVYWPFINQLDSFNTDYLEVGEPIVPIKIAEGVAGGSDNFKYIEILPKDEQKSKIPKGLNLNQNTGEITGVPEESTATVISVTIGLIDNFLSTSEVHATCVINFNQILPQFIFEDNSIDKILTTIKGNSDGQISIGEVLAPIDIMNYTESNVKVIRPIGGLPFKDKDGNEYYKFRGVNFRPDYEISIYGIISGQAVVGSEARKAQLYAMDARGKEIPLTKFIENEREIVQTTINKIISKLQLKKPLEITFKRIEEGSEIPYPQQTFNFEEYFVGGNGEYEASVETGSSLPEWLEIVNNGNTSFTIRQKSGSERTVGPIASYQIRVSDGSNPPQALDIPVYIGQIVQTMAFEQSPPPRVDFDPPLQIGVFSKLTLPKIVGGIEPYTFSSDGGFDGTDFKLYQDQGAEQDPNKFYIGVIPTKKYETIDAMITVTDGIGQSLSISLQTGQVFEGLEFKIIKNLSEYNFVAGYSTISEFPIIKGSGGVPFSGNIPKYNFAFNDQTSDIEIIPNVKFYGKNGDDKWYISSNNQVLDPTTIKYDKIFYQKEFKIIDSVGNTKTYSDKNAEHIWSGPRFYLPPIGGKTGEIIDYILQGTSFSSQPIFEGGVGNIAKHPDVKFYYSTNGSTFTELKPDDELKIGTTGTNLIWDEDTTTIYTKKEGISYFDKNTQFTFRAEIAKNDYNGLPSAGYVSANSFVKFGEVTRTLSWETATGEFKTNLNYQPNLKQVEDLTTGYTWSIDILDIVDDGTDIAHVSGGSGEYTCTTINQLPTGWTLNDSTLTYSYSDPEGKPSPRGDVIKISISDSNSKAESITLILTFGGVAQTLKMISYTSSISEYSINNGLIRDMSGNFDVQMSGGSGIFENYRFELVDVAGNNIEPYGVLGNGLFTQENKLKPATERFVTIGEQSRPGITGYLIGWDNFIDPDKKATIIKEIEIGAITDGLPYYKKEIEIPSGASDDPPLTKPYPISEYFFGSSKFTIEMIDSAGYQEWKNKEGSVQFNVVGDNIVATINYPKYATDPQIFEAKITSTEPMTEGKTMTIQIPVKAVSGPSPTPTTRIIGISHDGDRTLILEDEIRIETTYS